MRFSLVFIGLPSGPGCSALESVWELWNGVVGVWEAAVQGQPSLASWARLPWNFEFITAYLGTVLER